MESLIVPVILAVITLVFVVAAVVVGKREGKERAAIRERLAATPMSMAPASLMVQAAPDPPQTWVPVLTAGALVALGLTLLARNVFGAPPYSDPVSISNDCTAVFEAPEEARTTASIVVTLTSACPAALASSALYLDGADKSSVKLLQAPHRNEKDQAQSGKAYWYLTIADGVHQLMLLPRAGTRLKSEALTVPAASEGTAPEDVPVETTPCKVTAHRSAVVQSKFYTLELTSTCFESLGTEKVLVDGMDNKAIRLSSLPPAAPAKVADRWLITATAAPQRVDVVVDDGSPAANAITHDVRGKTPLGLGSAVTFATTTLGSLSTLAGLIAGVLALFRRP